MSAKSKNSGRSKRGLAVDRPFAPAIIAQAAKLVPQYRILVGYSVEDGCYVGEGVELPNAIGAGDTEAECIAEVRGNMTALVCYMLERGETPPLSQEPVRRLQVNVRFAPYEKATAEALAKAAGQTLSDFIRTAALGRA
jgi:predicted RNase H-like HicB family nuclease